MKRERKRGAVFTRRALLLGAGQLGALGVLATRLYHLQVVEGARYATLAENNRVSSRLLAPPRGRILDRSGTVLAGNRLNWRALLVPEDAGDVKATLDAFSALLPLDAHERARILRDVRRNRRFVPVLVRDFLSREDMARIEVNAPSLPGILVDVGTTRAYPLGPTLAHVVGYVAPPNEHDVAADPMLALPGMRVGRAGMERHDDVALRGHAGAVETEVNALGRAVRELDRREGTPGEELTLTVDAALQQKLMDRLGAEVSASAVVLDVASGEVMAMGASPSFDPGLFDSGVSESQWRAWMHDARAPLTNKAAAGLYPPGSTFKPVVALAALQAGTLTPTERINCPGYLDLGKARFHCWKRGGHGLLDLHGGLKDSCDVFFYTVAMRTGIDPIAAMAKRFGLGVDLGIELPDAKAGLMPTRAWRAAQGRHWNLGDTVVSGIGQGFVQVTPLALATMVARLAGGRAVQPRLTRSLGDAAPAGTLAGWPALDLPQRSLDVVRGGMWAVVNERGGTAPLARLSIPGVTLAGKTGSAQVRRVSREMRERGHFNSANLPWEFRPHALFVCYAPYEAPRYAVSVVVEHGNAGADVAGPAARDIMTAALMLDPAGRGTAPGRRLAQNGPG